MQCKILSEYSLCAANNSNELPILALPLHLGLGHQFNNYLFSMWDVTVCAISVVARAYKQFYTLLPARYIGAHTYYSIHGRS